MAEWYRKKGFKDNPLHIEPVFKDHLFGSDALLEEMFYRIDSGNIVFIEGRVGKTATLLKIIERYKGKGRVIYVNCEKVKDEPNIKVLLANGSRNILKRISMLPKRMILLLDNVKHLSESNAEKIKYYFDQDNILSVIMTGDDYSKTSIPESIKHRIGKRVYRLRDLTNDEIADIVLERLGFPDYVRKEHIGEIARKAKDLKHLLQECNSLFFIMENEGMEEVNDDIVKKLLHKKEHELVSGTRV